MTEEIIIQRNERIDELESVMLSNFAGIDCPITNYFTKDMYAREMFAPAESLLTSMIHKTEHFFILLKGKISVWDDEGEEKIIEAPFIGITKEGTRRVAYTHTDIIWATFHTRLENETVIIIFASISHRNYTYRYKRK